jgi:hypothetical protein
MPPQHVVCLVSDGFDLVSLSEELLHIPHGESSENVSNLKSDRLGRTRKAEIGRLSEIEVGMRGEHLCRPLPKSFGNRFANLEDIVELKLRIVDEANV